MWLLIQNLRVTAAGEHGFKDKCLLYQFWQDRDGSVSIPSSQDIAEAEEHLDEALQEMTRRSPDASLRLILRKQYVGSKLDILCEWERNKYKNHVFQKKCHKLCCTCGVFSF